MIRVLLPAFFAIWGAGILISKVLHFGGYTEERGGAYGFGSTLALVAASFMVVIGAYRTREAIKQRGGRPEVQVPTEFPIGHGGGPSEGSIPPPGRRP